MFDPVSYAWNVAHIDGPHDPPVTLADHEAAEREARKNLDERLLAGPAYDTPDIEDVDLAGYIADWGADVQDEARAWSKIANDLLAFKTKSKKKRAA